MKPNRTILIIINLFVLGALGFVVLMTVRSVTTPQITWSEAKKYVEQGKVDQVVFDGDLVHLILKDPASSSDAAGKTQLPPKTADVVRVDGDQSFIPLLEAHGVKYSARPPSGCGATSNWLLPLGLLFLFWMLLARREAGAPPGVATFGKSQARLAPEEGTGVTFDDVAGIDEAIEELQEVVEFLKHPEKFTSLGAKIPKGALLVGPPGTGKTLLARAVAGEAGVPFFSISGSDFVEMFVGVGAARVRDLFQKASQRAPCIIFIDELDAIGKARGGPSPVGGHDEREQTLNALLVEMDGFDGRKGIIIIAATNRPEILDPALLRAGRFDRQVLVDRPDVRGREAILEVHARSMALGEDVDLANVARMTPGFAGADLANALNEAALLAARRGRKAVSMADIEDAVERVVAGLEKKSRRLSPKEKRIVAYHEAGHAICAAASPGADPVHKISIIPRGIGALGYTLQTPLEDRYLMSRNELLNRLTVLYGGRAAEEMVFGDFTTGAADDIRKASDLARRMVAEYGMSTELGAVDYGGENRSPFGFGPGAPRFAISEQTAREVDCQVREILDQAHERARRLLLTHRDLLDRMALRLLEKEVVDRDDLARFLSEVKPAEEPTELEANEDESSAWPRFG